LKKSSCCRDCIDLVVDINLNSCRLTLNDEIIPFPGEEEGNLKLLNELLPQLEWMTRLRSLVLIKRRPRPFTSSPLLDGLLSSLLPNDQDNALTTPSLRHFWIQDFTFDYRKVPSFDRFMATAAMPSVLKSKSHTDVNLHFPLITCFPERQPPRIVKNLENTGGMIVSEYSAAPLIRLHL